MSNKKNLADKISLLGAVSIGIGGMVGGGIFAVLGLAVSMAKGATPLAFLISKAQGKFVVCAICCKNLCRFVNIIMNLSI